MTRFFFVGLLAMVLMAGCGSDNPPMGDGGSGGGGTGGTGGSLNDGGVGGSLGCDQVPAPGGELGGQCRGDTFECNGDLGCLDEQMFEVGGPDDPIRDYPPEKGDSFTTSAWPGDYCNLVLPPSPPSESGPLCTTDANIEACASVCGLCLQFLGADACLRGCRAEADTNSTCRDGYECDLLLEVCDIGCSSPDDCRVFREDTNMNGEIDGWDPVAGTGDRLVYDTESTYFCNPETYRCEHPGNPEGAEAGDPCEFDYDCEANGICLQGPNGYCSKLRCDIAGNECEGDGVCGFGLCLEPCVVGSDETTVYENNTHGCRSGYTCFWGGGDGDRSGVCDVGNFNGIAGTDNSIGEDCADDSICYSPFGQGLCGDGDFVCDLFGEPEGASCAGFGCTVLDCGVPGMPNDVCGDDATCVALSDTFSLCLEDCAAAESCGPGAACADLDGDPQSLEAVCFPFCDPESPIPECRAGEACNSNGQCAPETET